MSSLLSKLTPEQRSIIETADGHSLIIASAGTGKTTTIVGRIAYLLEVKKVKPENILLLTFTNKAAEEMIGRLKKHYSKDAIDTSKIWSGTFHSISHRLLRQLTPAVLSPYRKNFTIKTPSSLKTAFKTLTHEAKWPKDAISSSELLDLYWFSVNMGYTTANWHEFGQKKASLQSLDWVGAKQLLQSYERLKINYNAMDFNDLLAVIVTKLAEHPEAKSAVSKQFHYILVDEYQDTNALQERLIETLSSEHNQIFSVGDYDQTIFSFQGSDLSIIGGFTEKYSGAKVFNLKTNFRSTPEILSLANTVIEKNKRLYEKAIIPYRNSNHLAKPLPRYFVFPDATNQNQSVVKNIIATSITCAPSDPSYISLQETAIIYRSNRSGNMIELVCKEMNIPYVRKGGTSFFDRYEIEEALNIATIIANPHDALAWSRLLHHIPGMGSKSVAEFLTQLQSVNAEQSLLVNFLRWGHLRDDSPLLTCTPKGCTADLQDLHVSLKKLEATPSPTDFFQTLAEDTFFTQTMLWEYLKKTYKKGHGQEAHEQMAQRKDKVLLLVNLAEKYSSLSEMLNMLSLQSKEDSTPTQALSLLTIHSAKGLEWKKVFIIDLYHGSFPNLYLVEANHGIIDPKEALEEERRLFYVAITRAKDHLYLCYPKETVSAHKKEKNSASSFMEDVLNESPERVLVQEV